ncbi:MAG: YifB family Mg chelatase-like AAA ATPase [Myxococcales bacterium]|nr:YifB family Mg chelatase-like AAA ATPase [Myxococcales bacterium]
MHAKVLCGALTGVRAMPVQVEVDLAMGLPAFTIVGLPEGAVCESKVRVLAALKNCGYDLPPRRVTVNLAPADVKKNGSAFDLAIALGVLAGVGLVDAQRLAQYMVVGELGLDGRCCAVPGALPYVLMAREQKVRHLILPSDNAGEAAVIAEVSVLPVSSLSDALLHLTGEKQLCAHPVTEMSQTVANTDIDMNEVKGQENARRALEVAAAGAHNVIMIGPPGSGKTMLARRLSTILPPLSFEEMLEVSAAHSVLGLTSHARPLVTARPFRSPHHTVSDAGLVGGSNPPRPGEVSLAHNGILFLDELPEFKRHVLEVLREPLEEGSIVISRASGQTEFPANFSLVASMNPCPCGYHGSPERACVCGQGQVERYRGRISGPLLDRIDLHVDVPAVKVQELTRSRTSESSEVIRERVVAAREVQKERFSGTGIRVNGQMNLRLIQQHCALDNTTRTLLEKAIERLGLSARAYARILKVSRTIADLDGSEQVATAHVAEAIGYRTLDRNQL